MSKFEEFLRTPFSCGSYKRRLRVLNMKTFKTYFFTIKEVFWIIYMGALKINNVNRWKEFLEDTPFNISSKNPFTYLIHTGSNFILIAVARAISNFSKNDTFLISRIWKMGWIQPVKFRTWEMGICKMPRFQLGVFKTGVTVASWHNHWNCLYLPLSIQGLL